MTNDVETVEQVCEEFKTPKYTCKNCDFKICPSINMFSDRVLAAHNRELADEKRISGAVIKSLRDKKLEKDREVAEKDNEIASLRAALEVVKYALGESRIAICHICNIKHTCGHGTAKFDPCCIIKDIDSAIAAIRGVGGAK